MKSMQGLVCLAAGLCFAARGAAEEPPTPSSPPGVERESVFEFTEKPAVQATGKDRFEISFASKGYCDATVSILDKEGKVIRHLASGLLGRNAPPPLQRDSLAQKFVWDGKDDAGAMAPAGCRVRVALGLKPEFARMHCEARQGLASRGPLGLAVDKQGTLYIEEGDLFYLDGLGTAGVMQVFSVKAFDGEGQYVRTLVPFRADCPPEKVSEVEFVTTKDRRRVPLTFRGGNMPYTGFTPGVSGMVRNQPVITSGGRMIFPCGEKVAGKLRFISVGTDGSSQKELYEGPLLQPEARSGAQIFMALSPDEKFLYFAGARSKRDKGSGPNHAVYRIALDDKEPARAFIGKEFEAGKAEGQFDNPRGLEVDGQGRLWVGDYRNDRIQVFDAEGKFVKALAVVGPEQVKVHPKTGAVYVLSVRDRGATTRYAQATWEVYEDKSVLKFASMDDWTEVARIDLPKRQRYMHDSGPMLALDATRAEPVLWLASVGRQSPEDFLWKVLDRGAKLEKVPHKVVRYERQACCNPPLAADRRNNELYAFGSAAGHVRIDPASGQVKKLELAGEAGKAALARVGSAAVGPEGLLYIRSSQVVNAQRECIWHIRRFDRKGELVPFKKAGAALETNGRKNGTPWNEQATSFAVGPDGKLYVVGAYSRELDRGNNCRMDLYDPEGDVLTPGFLSMTRSGGCVRVDAQGRVYAADTVRPKATAFPDCYPTDPRGNLGRWYGTVFRFDPAGGGVADQAEGATHLAGGASNPLRPVVVKGAQWGFYGLSPMPLQTSCQCHIADFDADDWGRVWVPDAPGYCVAVLDAGGNLLTRFGLYGNRDATGAGGAVPEPPIPLWSPERVAALDGDAFVSDSLNTRIVQVRLKYAAAEELPIP